MDSILYRKIIFYSFVFLSTLVFTPVMPECLKGNISVFKEKPVKQSVSQLKNNIASSLQDILSQSTQLVRQITVIIDDVAQKCNELIGESNGYLSTNDKEILKSYQKQLDSLQEALEVAKKNILLK